MPLPMQINRSIAYNLAPVLLLLLQRLLKERIISSPASISVTESVLLIFPLPA
jgi:hypothetical protein